MSQPRQVNATEFKARCLSLIDQVALDRVPLVITKRGRPVARLMPMDSPTGRTTMGSVRILTEDDEALFSTGADWEAGR
jgi:prevent-host-death family protein